MPSALVGIINITPDSFSDGGKYADSATIKKDIAAMIAQGVAVIDIGAESTRPGAVALSATQEWSRLEPFFTQILPEFSHKTTFSIDTRHSRTARYALKYGVHWINDVSGFSDPAMIGAIKNSNCKLVLMHSLTVPADPSIHLLESKDPVAEIISFAKTRMAALLHSGVMLGRIIFDPGIGFNKTPAQSMEILRRIDEFKQLGVPLMVGHSRKSFLKRYADVQPDQRDALTMVISSYLVKKQVDYIRVHNTSAHMQMLKLHADLYA